MVSDPAPSLPSNIMGVIKELWLSNRRTAANPVDEFTFGNKSDPKTWIISFYIIIEAAAGSPVTEPGIKFPFKNNPTWAEYEW